MLKEETPIDAPRSNAGKSRSWIIACSSLFFILLQSACTAVMAISGLRLLIGIGSLASAATGLRLLAALHADGIRLPMEVLAIAGAGINLYVLWRIHSLRARPASQWRVRPVAIETKRAESIQTALALLTLLLVAAEWGSHLYLHGSI